MTAIAGAQRGYWSLGAKPGAIPELDGLRGIAILLVLLRHAARPIAEENGGIFAIGDWDLAVPLLNGWMGVDLFFVLSGFLITHHLMQRWPGRYEAGYFARYWLKRMLRTFPAYYATLTVVALGLLPFYRPRVEDAATEFWRHLVYMQDYFGSQWVPAFWSLGVEEKFYLLCPLILLWLGRFGHLTRIWILAALATLPMVLRALTLATEPDDMSYESFFWAVRSPFHLALDGLWLGVICALIHRWRPPALAGHPRYRHWLLISALVLLATLLGSVAWFDARYFAASVVVLGVVSAAFASIVLAVVLGPTFLSRWLRAGWLRFFAEISYSVYLTHLLVIGPALLSAQTLLPGWAAAHPLFKFAVFLPIFVTLSLLAGLALHFVVERPFLLLKDRVKLSPAR